MKWGSFLRRARATRRADGERAACALLAAAALAPLPLAAQATDGAEARTLILDPVTIGAGADMDFGEITTAGAPGTVTIPANAAPTCTMTGGLIHTGDCTAARFDGSAGWISTLRVTKPAGNQLTLTGPGGATMLVDNLSYTMIGGFTVESTPTVLRQFFLFPRNYTLYVGGRLNVATNQIPGTYSGTFTLSFDFE